MPKKKDWIIRVYLGCFIVYILVLKQIYLNYCSKWIFVLSVYYIII